MVTTSKLMLKQGHSVKEVDRRKAHNMEYLNHSSPKRQHKFITFLPYLGLNLAYEVLTVDNRLMDQTQGVQHGISHFYVLVHVTGTA